MFGLNYNEILGISCILGGLLLFVFGYKCSEIFISLFGSAFGAFIVYSISLKVELGFYTQILVSFLVSLTLSFLFLKFTRLATATISLITSFVMINLLTPLSEDSSIQQLISIAILIITPLHYIIFSESALLASSSFYGSWIFCYGIDRFLGVGFPSTYDILFNSNWVVDISCPTSAFLMSLLVCSTTLLSVFIQIFLNKIYINKDESYDEVYDDNENVNGNENIENINNNNNNTIVSFDENGNIITSYDFTPNKNDEETPYFDPSQYQFDFRDPRLFDPSSVPTPKDSILIYANNSVYNINMDGDLSITDFTLDTFTTKSFITMGMGQRNKVQISGNLIIHHESRFLVYGEKIDTNQWTQNLTLGNVDCGDGEQTSFFFSFFFVNVNGGFSSAPTCKSTFGNSTITFFKGPIKLQSKFSDVDDDSVGSRSVLYDYGDQSQYLGGLNIGSAEFKDAIIGGESSQISNLKAGTLTILPHTQLQCGGAPSTGPNSNLKRSIDIDNLLFKDQSSEITLRTYHQPQGQVNIKHLNGPGGLSIFSCSNCKFGGNSKHSHIGLMYLADVNLSLENLHVDSLKSPEPGTAIKIISGNQLQTNIDLFLGSNVIFTIENNNNTLTLNQSVWNPSGRDFSGTDNEIDINKDGRLIIVNRTKLDGTLIRINQASSYVWINESETTNRVIQNNGVLELYNSSIFELSQVDGETRMILDNQTQHQFKQLSSSGSLALNQFTIVSRAPIIAHSSLTLTGKIFFNYNDSAIPDFNSTKTKFPLFDGPAGNSNYNNLQIITNHDRNGTSTGILLTEQVTDKDTKREILYLLLDTPSPPTNTPSPLPTPTPSPTSITSEEETKKKKKNLALIISLSVILPILFILSLIFAVYLFKRNRQTTKPLEIDPKVELKTIPVYTGGKIKNIDQY
eukprot:gene4081-5109_t